MTSAKQSRHIPTTFYLDTEVFIGNGLHFEGKLSQLKDTFIEKGLRLLVPEVMERELHRHYRKKAKTVAKEIIKAHDQHSTHITNIHLPAVAKEIIKAHDQYPADKLSFVKLPSETDLEEQCLEEMKRQWSDFQEHFVVEKLPIVGNLEEVVDWYFETLPPFYQGKKKKEFPDAFIISTLDAYHKQRHANIAVISRDKDFNGACLTRRHLFYFDNLDAYIKAFQPEPSGEEQLLGATEDLQELKAIFARGDQMTPIEMERAMKLLETKGTNYDYFFQNVNTTDWLHPLSEQEYFDNPPDAKETTEGSIYNPWWPPLDYLIRIFDAAPDEVLDILSRLPDTGNFLILQGIFQIVLKADSADVVLRLSRFITSYVENDNCRWVQESIIDLLRKPFVFDSQLSNVTTALLLKIVEFRRDPHEQEKQLWRKEVPEALDTLLQPAPRFGEWEYQQILEQGVRPLAKREPYQVARILIDAVASMIRLGMHQQDFDKGIEEDSSEVWCRKLDEPDSGYQDIRGILVQTLTHACEQVYRKAPESVDPLDMALRNHRWKVFRRLRQYLYASYPNEQTLPWIREQLLDHEDYSRWPHHYEFQMMIHKASEHFGHQLLNVDQQKIIFAAIISGPSKMDFEEWMGEQYSEDAFQQRQHYFHRMQLRPFATLLSGEILDYFNKLEDEAQADAITDNNYLPVSIKPVRAFENRSPKSTEELQLLTDEELISYLNEWDKEYFDKENLSFEISISALVEVFQSLFKEQIVENNERLDFWVTNRDRIARPVYVTAMVETMLELVKEKHFDNLSQWIEFCTWVLSCPNSAREEGQLELRDESRDHPDWSRSRRAVVDFIEACVSKDNQTPISARNRLAGLLQKACNQFDWRLDHDHPVLLNQDGPFTEAINNTRSRALQSLVNFGFWVRHHLQEDHLPEVRDILSQRISDDAEIPLTRPEYALLGVYFGNLCNLIRDWAADHRESFFPRRNKAVWGDAFGSYLRFNQPALPVLEILRGEFEFAIDNLKILPEKNNGVKLVDRFGQHLFTYYLWEVYPLAGKESLLERFYDGTNNDRKRWAQLFDYVGRSLYHSDKHLNQALTDRIIAFFDQRFEVAEPTELRNFTFWLKAECLHSDWRLQSYLKILELGFGKEVELVDIYMQVEALHKLLPEHTALVVECLARITDYVDQEAYIHIPVDETRKILMAGLTAEDTEIQGNAERARENLLRSRRFEFMDF